jgi:hypothetical protein
MRREFEQFMKQRGAWDLFTGNLRKDIDTFFNENDPCDYLAAAFVWKYSPEGPDFWIRLQDKWDEEIRNDSQRN